MIASSFWSSDSDGSLAYGNIRNCQDTTPSPVVMTSASSRAGRSRPPLRMRTRRSRATVSST